MRYDTIGHELLTVAGRWAAGLLAKIAIRSQGADNSNSKSN